MLGHAAKVLMKNFEIKVVDNSGIKCVRKVDFGNNQNGSCFIRASYTDLYNLNQRKEAV